MQKTSDEKSSTTNKFLYCRKITPSNRYSIKHSLTSSRHKKSHTEAIDFGLHSEKHKQTKISAEIKLLYDERKKSRVKSLTDSSIVKVKTEDVSDVKAQQDEGYHTITSMMYNTEQLDAQSLLVYYSSQIFNQDRFKRFSRILKQKYLQMTTQKSNQNKNNKPEQKEGMQYKKFKEIHQKKLRQIIEAQQKKEQKRAQTQPVCLEASSFEPRLKIRSRPSSGIPLKKAKYGLILKKREQSFTVANDDSLTMKHIQALRYKDTRNVNSRSSNRKDSISPPKPTLQPVKALKHSKKQQTGDKWAQLKPWQIQNPYRHVQDLSICVDLSHNKN